jgi:inhibitor of KinA
MSFNVRSRASETSPCPNPRVLLCGDTGVSVEFGNAIDPGINTKVRRLYRAFKACTLPGILDIIPTYCSLFIQYDPFICSFEKLLMAIEEKLCSTDTFTLDSSQILSIPVCYESEFAPDIHEVAEFHGIDTQSVIQLHTAPIYDVYMIGFVLGFPYLGGLDERLHTPRKKQPRKIVPAGSVGIADRQAGIYPIQSPGGWQILGRTPVRIFDLDRANPFLLEMGDKVRFKPITRAEFENYTNH